RQFETRDLLATPLIVRAIADDELDLFFRTQQRQVLVAVPLLFARARRLHVDHTDNARVHSRERHRTTGLDGYAVVRVAQPYQQRQAVLLGQRFAAGDADVTRGRS